MASKQTNLEENGSDFKLPSPTEIEALKKKHGELSQITVVDKDGKEYHAIMRKPLMRDMHIASASAQKKPGTYNLSIWSNCKVVADPAIDADDVLLVGALNSINELVEVAESSIKKL